MSLATAFPKMKSPVSDQMADRIISAMAEKMKPAANRYEAAMPSSPDRPYIPAYTRDARYDATSYVRWEICRKVRYYRRNTWLLPRLEEVDVKYSVGPNGLSVTPASYDSEWNKRMEEAFLEWCEAPFRDSSLPMSKGHRLMAREVHDDGEVFANLTSLKWMGQPSKPAVELIESHRISSPGGEYGWEERNQNVIDGVILGRDAFGKLVGRAAGFSVRDGVEGESWRDIPAFDGTRPAAGGVVHVFDPDRIGMYRAISAYAPILNETADLELLAALEMDKAKTNSEFAGFIKTWNGELPDNFQRTVSGLGIRGEPRVPGTADDADLQKRIEQFRKVISARLVGLKPGEEPVFPANPSPSAAQQWLWKLTIEKICAARGIPMLLVLPDSIQGTVARAILDDANLTFRSRFRNYAIAAHAFYMYFASWAIYNVKGLQNPPADWRKCHITSPRACNVDVGRNSAAMLAEWAMGKTNLTDIASSEGTTARKLLEKKADDVGLTKTIATEKSAQWGVEIQPAEIMQNIGEVAALINPPAMETEEDEEKAGTHGTRPSDPNKKTQTEEV